MLNKFLKLFKKKEDEVVVVNSPASSLNYINYIKYFIVNEVYLFEIETSCCSRLHTEESWIKYLKECSFNLYDPYSNKFVCSSSSTVCLSKIRELTKEEYDVLFQNKICECEIGAGTNVVRTKYYNEEEELNKKYPQYHVELSKTDWVTGVSFRYCYVYNNKCIEDNALYTFVFEEKNYKQQACINCMKCLDNLNELFERFEEKINIEEKRKAEIELVKKICNK